MTDIVTGENSELEDARRLEFTLKTRENIVKGLYSDNKLPTENSDKALLIAALDGIDRTILARTKIKVESKQADNAALTNSVITAVLSKINIATARDPSASGAIPTLDATLEKPILVEGETAVGTQAGDIDSFMKKMGQDQVDD